MVFKLYNGCPNSELQAVWDSRDAARKRLAEEVPGAFVTYFPLEGKYAACTKDYKPLGEFHSSVEATVEDAIRCAKKI